MSFPNKKPTTYEVLGSHGVSRRTFLDFCTRTTALMGLAPAMVPSVGKALLTQPRVPVIWLHGLETRLCARWLKAEYGALATADSGRWDTATWTRTPAKGFGFTEAPRGACAHWIRIGSDKKIANYQIVVPSIWNASPKDGAGKEGAYESALLGTSLADSGKPLEIPRTIHAFDPCLACATHVVSNGGRTLAEVVVR
ncbi:MAG: nickel-dependent hydrogenase large subunit [Bryobacterales bacterium]|nr:nickel-dependent hydrogenase large subunit [Bryobacterales bacterium]